LGDPEHPIHEHFHGEKYNILLALLQRLGVIGILSILIYTPYKKEIFLGPIKLITIVN
jgi:hypothetical protein